jgi:hypothetical protein
MLSNVMMFVWLVCLALGIELARWPLVLLSTVVCFSVEPVVEWFQKSQLLRRMEAQQRRAYRFCRPGPRARPFHEASTAR